MRMHEASFDCSVQGELFELTSDAVLLADRRGAITRLNSRAASLFPDGASVGMAFWTRLGLPCGSLWEAQALCSAPGGRFTCASTQTAWEVRLAPLGADAGRPEGYLLVLREVTALALQRTELERQARERALALARSKKMLRGVFQGVGKGIILIDEDREVIESNQKACETFGIHPENMLGAHVGTLCEGSDRNVLMRMMDGILENQVLSAEVTGLYFDKRTFPAVFTVSVITVEGSRLWIIITEDISRQKAMENQLKAEKVLTEEANIALRNVLKNIQSEQEDVAGKLAHKITQDILPILPKIRTARSEEIRGGYIDFLAELLSTLTRGLDPQAEFAMHRLSKTEMKICNFVLAGFSSKEICATMNLAFDTVQTHRKNIRRKLGLSGSAKISLHGFLNGQKMPSNAFQKPIC